MHEYDKLNPEFYDLLEESNFWLANRTKINHKFNGQIIKKHIPDYDMTRLSTTMPMFKNKFDSSREFELFILNSSEESMIAEFIELTENEEITIS